MAPIEGLQVDPWTLSEVGFDLDRLPQLESLFALSNGHIGVRGNLDEGDPVFAPGTYLNSFCETRPLPHAEAGYGFPQNAETVVNVTDGKVIRLIVDDHPLDMRYGTVREHERELDMRTGLLSRSLLWETPAGQQVRVKSQRLVSFTQRAVMAINYEVEAVDEAATIVVQSDLIANEEEQTDSDDPRVAAVLDKPLELEEKSKSGRRTMLVHATKESKLRVATACVHEVNTDIDDDGDNADDEVHIDTHLGEDWARTTVGVKLQPGEKLRLTKFVAYGWSSQRSIPALRDQVDAALMYVKNLGWDRLVAEQKSYLDEFWDGADIEIDGPVDIQQAARFALWHVLQAGARAEGRPIAAKGLTGAGYDGHAFWDTEQFVLPVLVATVPRGARDLLLWRRDMLPQALDRAQMYRLDGAVFPWRTINGDECSGYWPAGTAAFHLNAVIAVAAARYVAWTDDDEFDREVALELLVHTARMWKSFGYFGDDGEFHINGVTGPDEYSAIVDDNIFTNLMAGQNLRFAADVCERWPDKAAAMEVTSEEIATWRKADDKMAMPFDEHLDIYSQDRGFTEHAVWDFEETYRKKRYPLLMHYPYFDIYRKQVIKQADLVLAMHWCGDKFTAEEKAKAFHYYEHVTIRDSSLSPCSQSIMAAEVGHLDLAYDYLMEAVFMDLHDLANNTKDGMHMACLAGTWLSLVCGFGGLRDHGGSLSFRPQLPEHFDRLAFALHRRGCKIRVEVTKEQATYTLDCEGGPDIEIEHEGEAFTLTTGQSVTRPINPVEPLTPKPMQPVGLKPGLGRFVEL